MKNKPIYPKILIWVLFALFFFLPFERIPSLEILGFTLKISYIFGSILLLFALIFSKYFKTKIEKSDIFLALFLLYGFLSIFWSADITRALVIWLLWLFVALIYKSVASVKINLKNKDLILKIIIFSALLTSLFGIYQFIADSLGISQIYTGLRYQYTKAILGFPRIQSVALEPLYFSNYLLIPFFVTFAMFYEKKKCFVSCVMVLMLILINIFLGVSRGAYLSLAIVLLILFGYFAVKKEWAKIVKTLTILLASFLISVGLLYFLNGGEAINTFSNHTVAKDTGTEVSTVGRVDVYKEAWQTFKEKPLGIGVASWGVQHQGLVDYSDIKSYGNVNNQYLEVLVETGIIGFSALILFLIFYFIEVLRIIKTSKDKLYLVLMLLGLSAIFIQYNFFSTLYIIYVWAFMGLIKMQNEE